MKRLLTSLVLIGGLICSCQKQILDSPQSLEGPVLSDDLLIDRVMAVKTTGKYSDTMAACQGGGIVFVVNSQIERWIYYSWDRDWAGLPAINRGIGGTTWNSMYNYIDTLITDYNPKIIVLYGAENEYNAFGKRADQISLEFNRYFTEVRRQNPAAHIVVLSMLKIPKLRALFDDITKLNQLYQAKSMSDANSSYIDITSLYSPDNAALWRPDGIHLSTYVPFATIRTRIEQLMDVEEPVDTRPVLFLGSSTIKGWDIDKSFPELNGNWRKIHFAGFTWKNIFDNLKLDTIAKLNPRQVVIYSGDNDIVQRIALVTMQTYFQRICREKIWAHDSTIKVTLMYTKPSNPTRTIVYPSGETGWNIIKYFNRNMNNWLQNYHKHHATASADTYSPNLRYNQLINEHYKGLNDVHWTALGYDVNDEKVRPLLIH